MITNRTFCCRHRCSSSWHSVNLNRTKSIVPRVWLNGLTGGCRADVSIPDGSIWRITFDGVEYILTGIYDNIANDYSLGNPFYNGGTDDNSGVPFFFWHTPWGAWSGGADVTPDTSHSVKIERQVT